MWDKNPFSPHLYCLNTPILPAFFKMKIYISLFVENYFHGDWLYWKIYIKPFKHVEIIKTCSFLKYPRVHDLNSYFCADDFQIYVSLLSTSKTCPITWWTSCKFHDQNLFKTNLHFHLCSWPHQGSNPYPLLWKHKVLTTGSLGSTHKFRVSS